MNLTRFVSKGKIVAGRLVLDNERWFRTILSKYDDTDKLRIIIEKERGTRTQKQNAYYWSQVLGTIAAYVGEQPEDLHEIFKAMFLKRKRLWRGAEMTILSSTAKLTSEEFGEYIERCIMEGAALGVVVQAADKNWDLIESTTLASEIL